MARAIVTARVTQEQYAKINQLVNNGIFSSRSAVIQTFVKLGLEHCNLREDAEVCIQVSEEFKIRARLAAQNALIHELAKSIIEELSRYIEAGCQEDIKLNLLFIMKTITQLPIDAGGQLAEILKAEPVYQVAQQMVKGE